MSGPPGRKRLLDAAERLFAEQGIDATSARAINAAANLSPAALHYHFGNKEKLVEEVLYRRMGTLNERRAAMLTDADGQAVPITSYLLAELLVIPLTEFALDKGAPGHWYIRFLSRLYNEKAVMMVRFIEATYTEGIRVYDEMTVSVAPHLDLAEARRRRVIAGEAATHGVAHMGEYITDHPEARPLIEPMVHSLIAFVAGGLTAPLR